MDSRREMVTPTATDWLLTSVKSELQPVIRSTYLVFSKKTSKKGTAFSLSSGIVITNEHVVGESAASDLVLIASTGENLRVNDIVADSDVDLAALNTEEQPRDGFRVQTSAPSIGERVHTWGYPLAYNGPSPILSVGYLAGFNTFQATDVSPVIKRYVVNGAFNPGNSGGPLISAVEDAIVGVVVSKHAPISQWHLSALEALKNQKSGLQYTATDADGVNHSFAEGQLVGDLLQYFRDLTQVVIGEAISAEEVIRFLDSNRLPWEPSDT